MDEYLTAAETAELINGVQEEVTKLMEVVKIQQATIDTLMVAIRTHTAKIK